MTDRPPDLLTAHAVSQPDKPAVIDDPPGGRPLTVTFGELEAWSERVAAALAGLGVG